MWSVAAILKMFFGDKTNGMLALLRFFSILQPGCRSASTPDDYRRVVPGIREEVGSPRTLERGRADRSDHQEVKTCLCYSGNADAKLAGDRLADLGTARRRADYEIDKPLDRHGDDPLAYVRVQVEAAENI